eukprot:TRINITY_DN2425_c0_g1_i1.p1 TRINITY_DN2425_c0_g1~~TRINITY_DN2425_c0_g1_i1.p1  ORF type:complete len:1049 (+),score=213.40 TRINITY_DN2425_c0_g1_i1:232-3378(+)
MSQLQQPTSTVEYSRQRFEAEGHPSQPAGLRAGTPQNSYASFDQRSASISALSTVSPATESESPAGLLGDPPPIPSAALHDELQRVRDENLALRLRLSVGGGAGGDAPRGASTSPVPFTTSPRARVRRGSLGQGRDASQDLLRPASASPPLPSLPPARSPPRPMSRSSSASALSRKQSLLMELQSELGKLVDERTAPQCGSSLLGVESAAAATAAIAELRRQIHDGSSSYVTDATLAQTVSDHEDAEREAERDELRRELQAARDALAAAEKGHADEQARRGREVRMLQHEASSMRTRLDASDKWNCEQQRMNGALRKRLLELQGGAAADVAGDNDALAAENAALRQRHHAGEARRRALLRDFEWAVGLLRQAGGLIGSDRRAEVDEKLAAWGAAQQEGADADAAADADADAGIEASRELLRRCCDREASARRDIELAAADAWGAIVSADWVRLARRVEAAEGELAAAREEVGRNRRRCAELDRLCEDMLSTTDADSAALEQAQAKLAASQREVAAVASERDAADAARTSAIESHAAAQAARRVLQREFDALAQSYSDLVEAAREPPQSGGSNASQPGGVSDYQRQLDDIRTAHRHDELSQRRSRHRQRRSPSASLRSASARSRSTGHVSADMVARPSQDDAVVHEHDVASSRSAWSDDVVPSGATTVQPHARPATTKAAPQRRTQPQHTFPAAGRVSPVRAAAPPAPQQPALGLRAITPPRSPQQADTADAASALQAIKRRLSAQPQAGAGRPLRPLAVNNNRTEATGSSAGSKGVPRAQEHVSTVPMYPAGSDSWGSSSGRLQKGTPLADAPSSEPLKAASMGYLPASGGYTSATLAKPAGPLSPRSPTMDVSGRYAPPPSCASPVKAMSSSPLQGFDSASAPGRIALRSVRVGLPPPPSHPASASSGADRSSTQPDAPFGLVVGASPATAVHRSLSGMALRSPSKLSSHFRPRQMDSHGQRMPYADPFPRTHVAAGGGGPGQPYPRTRANLVGQQQGYSAGYNGRMSPGAPSGGSSTLYTRHAEPPPDDALDAFRLRGRLEQNEVI